MKAAFQGRKKSFLVLARWDLEDYEPEEEAIVISITDPEEPDVEMKCQHCFKDILRLKFHDLPHKVEGYNLIEEGDASQILEFVKKNIDDVGLIVVQCEVGMSRSAGVAAALSFLIQGEDSWFYENYRPNRIVKDLIVKVAESRKITFE